MVTGAIFPPLGLTVVRAVVLVDRQEGGLDNIRQHVPDASAIILRDELVHCWEQMEKTA